MPRFTGKVCWFNESKGFGYIDREDGNSVFFHHGALHAGGLATVPDGALVEYEVPEGADGLPADSVRALSSHA